MKLRYLILLLLLPGMSSHIRAQSVTVTENRNLKKQAVNLEGYAVVDINANLTIELKKAMLTNALASNIGSSPDLNAQLTLLNHILKSQTRILELLKPNIAAAGATNTATQREEYYRLMIAFFDDLMNNPLIRARVNGLYQEYFDPARIIDKTAYPYPQAYVIKNLSIVTDELVSKLQKAADLSKVNIQVTAAIRGNGTNTNKVHVTNFDTYADGVFYEIPQWVTNFSADDVKKFQEATAQAAVLNRLVDQNFNDVKTVLKQQLNSLACAEALLDEIQQMTDSRESLFKDELTAGSNYLTQIKAQLSAIKSTITAFNNDPKTALEQFNNAAAAVIKLGNNFQSTAVSLGEVLPASVKSNPRIKAFQASLSGCMGKIKQDIELINNMAQVVSSLLAPFKQTAGVAENIQGEALSFTIDKLPAKGFIDLKTTGKRANGDELIINILYVTPQDIQNKVAGRVLETYSIRMHQIAFYSESFVSVVGVRPLQQNDNVKLGGRIQFAPSGSLLAKFGSRTSPLWNALNPGLGISLAAPDFDLDGSPEVSYGGVLSIFRNILSAGLGYNTKTSSSYWFFGVSLPFASIVPFGQPKTN